MKGEHLVLSKYSYYQVCQKIKMFAFLLLETVMYLISKMRNEI